MAAKRKNRVNADLMAHIESLGLTSVEQYRAWCSANGLSTQTHKSSTQRRNEKRLARQLSSDTALKLYKNRTRRPQKTIRAIYEGKLTMRRGMPRSLGYLVPPPKTYSWGGVRREGAKSKRLRHALLQLLLQVEKQGAFSLHKSAIVHLGDSHDYDFVNGLWALAYWHKLWLRDPADWRPASHNLRKQFGSLARHLLAKYDVPAFMDIAWFCEEDEARRVQGWFVHMGTGGNIRKADVPLTLTKKMAHLFLQSPQGYTIYEAFRRAQILGLGGEEPLVHAVNGSRLGSSFVNEHFWHTVVHFFVNNPMLDPDEVGPIVDYIHNQKYVPREERVDGRVVELSPVQPNFSIKGRSVVNLLREVEMWHGQLARQDRLSEKIWDPSGLNGLDWTVRDNNGNEKERWTITELLSSKELSLEGRKMHHCVGSYANSCKSGMKSIWTMEFTTPGYKIPNKVLTIAVENATRRISEARGKYNARPSRKARQVLSLWRTREGMSISRWV